MSSVSSPSFFNLLPLTSRQRHSPGPKPKPEWSENSANASRFPRGKASPAWFPFVRPSALATSPIASESFAPAAQSPPQHRFNVRLRRAVPVC